MARFARVVAVSVCALLTVGTCAAAEAGRYASTAPMLTDNEGTARPLALPGEQVSPSRAVPFVAVCCTPG